MMNNVLSQINWEEKMADLNVEEAWQVFKSICFDLIDKHVPANNVEKKISNKPKWFNNEIKVKLSQKKSAWKEYRNNPSEEAEARYKKLNNQLRKVVKNGKRQFEMKLASEIKSCPKRFYSYVTNKNAKDNNVGPIQTDRGLLTNNLDIANELNSYFSSVLTIENLSNMPSVTTNVTAECNTLEVSELIVLKELESLKTSKSAGPDKLSPFFLNALKSSIAKPLALIYTKSLLQGYVPTDFKLAHITPIHKKGSKKQACN